jgi:hypothetical protein
MRDEPFGARVELADPSSRQGHGLLGKWSFVYPPGLIDIFDEEPGLPGGGIPVPAVKPWRGELNRPQDPRIHGNLIIEPPAMTVRILFDRALVLAQHPNLTPIREPERDDLSGKCARIGIGLTFQDGYWTICKSVFD